MHRRYLLLGAAAPLAAPFIRPAQAATVRRAMPAVRRLTLRHAATGERFDGPYHDGRSVDPAALADISRVLADSRTGTVHLFDPAVLDFLWEAGQRSGLRGEYLVVSGFRTPATNAAVCGAGNSQHLRAGALDVCIASAQLTGFGSTAIGLNRGGVGVYASRNFVHLDSGPARHWGTTPESGGGGGHTAPAAPVDPLARMAEAWAATRTP